MPDTRLPDRWLNDITMLKLSDRGWRFFTSTLMVCNSQGTDGFLEDDHLRFLRCDASEEVVQEIVDARLMERVDGGYQYANWDRDLGQSTAASIAAKREGSRRRSQTHRTKTRAANATTRGDDTRDEARDVTRDVTGLATRADEARTGQARTGQARPGQAGEDSGASTSHLQLVPPAQPITGWPTAVPGDGYCRVCGGDSDAHIASCALAA